MYASNGSYEVRIISATASPVSFKGNTKGIAPSFTAFKYNLTTSPPNGYCTIENET